MKSYIVAPTKEEAEAEDGVEVMASSPTEAAKKYERMGYDIWLTADEKELVWVFGEDEAAAVCVDIDEGEIIEDGEEGG
jgi:hypothetical protein